MPYSTNAGVRIWWEEHGTGAIPNATLVMLPHASHIFLTDQLELARDAILAFLDRASGDTAKSGG